MVEIVMEKLKESKCHQDICIIRACITNESVILLLDIYLIASLHQCCKFMYSLSYCVCYMPIILYIFYYWMEIVKFLSGTQSSFSKDKIMNIEISAKLMFESIPISELPQEIHWDNLFALSGDTVFLDQYFGHNSQILCNPTTPIGRCMTTLQTSFITNTWKTQYPLFFLPSYGIFTHSGHWSHINPIYCIIYYT